MEPPKKSNLRREFRTLRKTFSDERREAASRALLNLKEKLSPYEIIASFASFGDEIDMYPLNSWIASEKTLAIPRGYSFYKMTRAPRHTLGFFEPDEECELLEKVDCILVPGLVFDKVGHRIGYGGGMYDKLLRTHEGVPSVGIAFEEQFVDELPVEEFDFPVENIYLV